MSKFKVGDRVDHVKYGLGVVEEIHSQNNCIKVKFDKPNKYGLILWLRWEENLSHYPPPKYKLVKEITLEVIIEAGVEISCSTFIDFAT